MLVCGLCPFMTGLWVGLCLFLAMVVGWYVFQLYSSWGLRVGMWSVSLPHGVVGWSVVGVSSSMGLCVGLWYLPLPSGGCGFVCVLVVFLSGVVGLYVVCVSSSRGCGLVCAFSSPGFQGGLWSVSLPRQSVGLGLWSMSLPREGRGSICGLCLFLAGVVG